MTESWPMINYLRSAFSSIVCLVILYELSARIYPCAHSNGDRRANRRLQIAKFFRRQFLYNLQEDAGADEIIRHVKCISCGYWVSLSNQTRPEALLLGDVNTSRLCFYNGDACSRRSLYCRIFVFYPFVEVSCPC